MRVTLSHCLVTPRRPGFTIVELALVVTIIGILAGLVNVSISNWRKGLADKEVKSDVVQITAALKNAANFTNGFPVLAPGSQFDASAAAANTAIYRSSTNVQLTYVRGNATSYCIQGQSRVVVSVMYFTTESQSATAGACP